MLTWSAAGRGHVTHPEISIPHTQKKKADSEHSHTAIMWEKEKSGILLWFISMFVKYIQMIWKEKHFFESLMLLEKWQILETSVWCVSITWKDSLFLRCLRLSLSRDFCFSSSSSFSRARMCSSKQISASSLSMSETDTNSFTLLHTSQKGLYFISSDWRSETVGLQPF